MKNYYAYLSVVPFVLLSCQDSKEKKETKKIAPNIIYIMVDDMGYGDLGCYGQQVIKTPNIDKMAQEGMRFTECYSGSPVSAPARSALMTGQHTGHTTLRGNKAQIPTPYANPKRVPLNESDTTLAEILKGKDYVTGMFGKWGLGENQTPGEPNNQGFDEWFGFLNQKRAHWHFPEYLWDNQDTFWLEGNDRCCKGKTTTFAHDLFTQRALNFIDKNKDTSFFLYVPYTLPHGGFIIPEEEYAQFDDKDWSDQQKVYAGMIERIDKDMGLLFDALKEYGIDSNTLVFFCSDNGAANRYEGLFNSSGALKGRKRDMYEGGIRVPMIVRMPGLVPAGEVSDHPWYFPDVMPTLAEITGASLPDNIDGISIAPLLKGENLPSGNRFMYWEFHEGQFAQAARWKNWKAVRYEMSDTLELYNLSKDLAEDNNIAKDHPEITKKMIEYLNTERTESKYWKP